MVFFPFPFPINSSWHLSRSTSRICFVGFTARLLRALQPLEAERCRRSRRLRRRIEREAREAREAEAEETARRLGGGPSGVFPNTTGLFKMLEIYGYWYSIICGYKYMLYIYVTGLLIMT